MYYLLLLFIFYIDGFISLTRIKKTNTEVCIVCLNRVKEHIFCLRCFEVYIQSFDKRPTRKIKFNKILKLYDLIKKTICSEPS